jgi:hypothetical protein
MDKFKYFKIARILGVLSWLCFALSMLCRFQILFIFSAGIFALCVLTTTLWTCPACGKLFCTKIGSNWPFISKCCHCGKTMIEINNIKN